MAASDKWDKPLRGRMRDGVMPMEAGQLPPAGSAVILLRAVSVATALPAAHGAGA